VVPRRAGAATLMATLLLAAVALAGCGQKGPLTLPAAAPAASGPAAAR
jgi:predicted small lipoprotein YifL